SSQCGSIRAVGDRCGQHPADVRLVDLTLPDRRLGGLDSVQVGRPVHRAGPQVPGRAGPEVGSAVLVSTLVSRARRPGTCRASSRCGGAWSGPFFAYAREPPGVHRATELPGESPPATG